jgi:hypothetical protein
MKFSSFVLAFSVFALDAQVANIFEQKCLKCHGGESTLGGLDLTKSSLSKVVTAGNPQASLLFQHVTSGKMPQVGPKLTASELETVRTWIESGAAPLGIRAATKRQFWSFRTPVKSPGNSIDEFILAKLKSKGITANPPADERTLIRRLHFDLTGLPPKPEDYTRSYEDTIEHLLASPQYAERWARHWLDVVRFGETDGGEHNYERLHAWPYRDYVIDAFRTDKPYTQFIREQIAGDLLAPTDPKMIAATGFLVAGPWDQVSAELNKDKILAATARVDELDDMATTTFHTFQALTVNCARCHDHKFDPIPSKDFYRLTAVYSGVTFGTRKVASEEELKAYDVKSKPVRDRLSAVNRKIADIEDPVRARLLLDRYKAFDKQRANEARRIPLNPVWNRNSFPATNAKHLRMAITSHKSDRAQIAHVALEPAAIHADNWTAPAKATADAPVMLSLENPTGKRIDRIEWWSDQKTARNTGMPEVFRLEASEDGVTWQTLCSSLDHVRDLEIDLPRVAPEELPERSALLAERQRIETELEAIPEPLKLYAAKPKAMDKAFLLERGSVAKPKEEVTPGALSAVNQLSPDIGIDAAATDKDRRLALANWIASDKNPLTARVLVNRIWYNHFGNGIVNTPSDFGLNGDRPSHPELLDWLAVSFMENGWSIKWLHRQILKSEAYRRSGALNEAAFAADADNRLLWRNPLKRMDAEMLRDSILFASGQLRLSPVGGPGFMLQKKKDRGAFIYEVLDNDGPEVWRRAIYRFVVRGGERIMMDSFDCPDPSVATPQRSISNTPVQALTLLNNDFVLRQANLFAERLVKEAGQDASKQVQIAYSLLYGRNPSAKESQLGQDFIRTQTLPIYTRALFNTNEFLYVP